MSAARTNALLVPVVPDAKLGEAILGHVAARLSGRLRQCLANVASTEISIEASTGVASFGEWIKPGSRSYQIGSSGVFIARVDPLLADMLLELRLGGGNFGHRQPDGKQGRATGSMMESVADVVSLAVADGWPGGGEVQLVATDNGTQLARADDQVATIVLAVSTLGTMIGQIGVAFPAEGLARVSGPAAAPRDGDWRAKLRGSMLAARMPVRAIVAQPELPAATVMRLAVGDVLPISKPDLVALYSGDHVVGKGAIIEIAGRTAIQFQTTEPCHD